MAKREIVIDLCDRCMVGKEKEATTERQYATGPDMWWLLKLCEQHGEMFDRDIGVWTRLSAETDPPSADRPKSQYFTEERKREARRIAELRDRVREDVASREFAARRAAELQADEDRRAQSLHDRNLLAAIPGALGWKWTTHAHERMSERGFTEDEVLRTAAQPEHTYPQEWRAPGRWIYQGGDCRIAVDVRTKTILTVIDRSDTLDMAAPNGADQKVQVAQ